MTYITLWPSICFMQHPKVRENRNHYTLPIK